MKLFFILSGLFIVGCSSSSDEPTPTPQQNNNQTTTYNAHVKTIIDNNCISCHSATTPAAGLPLTTYAEVKSAVQNNGLISRINNSSNPMPQGGLMSQTNRSTISDWEADGLLEN